LRQRQPRRDIGEHHAHAGPDADALDLGARVRMVFTDIAPGLALPQWTIDESGAGGTPWRYRG